MTQLLKPNAFPTLLLLLQNPNENKFRNTFTFKRALVVATVTLLPSLSQQSKQNRIYSDYVLLSKRGKGAVLDTSVWTNPGNDYIFNLTQILD